VLKIHLVIGDGLADQAGSHGPDLHVYGVYPSDTPDAEITEDLVNRVQEAVTPAALALTKRAANIKEMLSSALLIQ
jgi:hypothetical protein